MRLMVHCLSVQESVVFSYSLSLAALYQRGNAQINLPPNPAAAFQLYADGARLGIDYALHCVAYCYWVRAARFPAVALLNVLVLSRTVG